MMTNSPTYLEDHVSQIPAIQVLINLGYQYLPPEEAVRLRGGKTSGVLLDGILESQLRKLNKIQFKGEQYTFSEGNIQTAVMSLKDVLDDGLVRTNEKIYDLLTLGRSLPQTILGDTKSFPINYIEWNRAGQPDDPNVYHVTAEFVVDRPGVSGTPRRPDIVLFVNGIPLVVIECKSPALAGTDKPVERAVRQTIGNQKDADGIPKLFWYSQLLLALAKNDAMYATTGTPLKFWASWREKEIADGDIDQVVQKSLSREVKDRLFTAPFKYARAHFDELEAVGRRDVTEQDRALCCLCRRDRLLELVFRYTVFDCGEKKIARYQQYFAIRRTLERIRKTEAGRRTGGVVWHTQGSGKSLTMVMLAEAIALEPEIVDYKIVLVTDRVDLDDQIYKTFQHCGAEVVQARTGAHLIELINGNKSRIITTIIDKFEAALSKQSSQNRGANIFVLVDESHRGQYGPMHAKMRKVLLNACFVGFTGTPVTKKDKNTLAKFGGLIDAYPITQAVEDKAVVPLLYEGRHVSQTVHADSIDSWFKRITEGLTKDQVADLKKKFARTDQLNKAEQKVMRIAWDISTHYRDNWKGTPFKAQLVAQDKSTALLYKKFLDEFGMVTSEVLISGPGDREGDEEVAEDNEPAIIAFWKKMMARYGTGKQYDRQVIDAFKNAESPEIIVVVDKLLTGFDAPKNTVLYLTRMLKEHTLLQAIARVNRLYEGKEFGYIIDYRGVLQKLDEALTTYGSLSDYDKEDLANTVTEVAGEVAKLPQCHSDLWELFKTIKNRQDAEAFERLLADNDLRTDFYQHLSKYARTLAVAMSSLEFIEKTPTEKIDLYKKHLKFFLGLRVTVQKRYAEVVDFREYEAKIQKLIDTHVGTGEVEQVTGLVNIFDADAFQKEVEELHGVASKADTIAYRTSKTIRERMEEDPAFYKRFSEMPEEAIKAFREQRLSDAEYLKQVTKIGEAVRGRTGDDIPLELRQYEVAKAFYGIVVEVVSATDAANPSIRKMCTDAALRIDEVINHHRIVNWTANSDVQNRMRTDIEDHLFEMKKANGLSITFDDIDKILERCIGVAGVRYKS